MGHRDGADAGVRVRAEQEARAKLETEARVRAEQERREVQEARTRFEKEKEARQGLVILGGIGVVVLLLVLVFSSSNSDKNEKSGRSSSPTSGALAAAPSSSGQKEERMKSSPTSISKQTRSPRQDDEATLGEASQPTASPNRATKLSVGDEFTLGDFQYRITTVRATNSIGGEFLSNENAGPEGTFIIVDFDITNVGTETDTVMTDDFEIKTPDGVAYRPDSDAVVAYAEETNRDLLLMELHPGLLQHSSTVFRIPRIILRQHLELDVPKKGLLSTGHVTVSLEVKCQNGAFLRDLCQSRYE